jgi:hypothetical protein
MWIFMFLCYSLLKSNRIKEDFHQLLKFFVCFCHLTENVNTQVFEALADSNLQTAPDCLDFLVIS